MDHVVVGLDVGTGGARALAVTRAGRVIARSAQPFAHPPHAPQPGYAEQDAREWWLSASACLRSLMAQLTDAAVSAVAVDSTSGTFVPVAVDHTPLMPALMYNDNRAAGLEDTVNAAAGDFTARLGYTFPPAFSLVKMAWLARYRPDVVAQTHKFLHAADYLNGHLTGDFDTTDTSNALKSGVDLLAGVWPSFIEDELHIPLAKLPRVFEPGQQLGVVSTTAAAESGLPAGTPVVAGASDGTASFLASGARQVGDWNITIGTTIVIRGIARELHLDPQGRLYSHRHPEGFWLPGGASNVGGEALLKTFGDQIGVLDEAAATRVPSGLVVYPLIRTGERMPFVSAHAEGFMLGAPSDEVERFTGFAEGVALVAAWSLDEAAALGAPVDGELFFTGGAAHGRTVGGVLASVLERPLIVTAEPDAGMGSALLAAGWAWYGGVSAAQEIMVERIDTIYPVLTLTGALKLKLEELKSECHRRQYL
jgi:xylulokinase